MNDADYISAEDAILALPESLGKTWAIRLLLDWLRLNHDLDDPRYKYADSRISRFAIRDRDQTIDQLRQRVRELTKATEAKS